MKVVQHHAAIKTRIADQLLVGFVSGDRLFAGESGRLPVAATNIDMRGHVRKMRQSRREISEAVGGSLGLFKLARCLKRVDDQMHCVRMVRMQREDLLQRLDNLARRRQWLSGSNADV